MKKAIIFLSLSVSLFAHNLIMNVMDNKDNTITVIGEFSTGEDAAGALVRVESLISGDVLYKERLPEASEVTISIPKEPYQVVLDGGPGHTIVKEGIAPLEGFNEEIKSKIDSTKKLSVAQNANNEWDLIIKSFLFLATLL
ncbi:hypothetical protein [Aliarcobacter butzleri]|uniref:hypothetical protein n=1 Tax=Aliarcobacter butzleri TaxID=28197 RepID=UPI002B249C8F|nr:hypothetical protein [Aliarcobacter butzleri]